MTDFEQPTTGPAPEPKLYGEGTHDISVPPGFKANLVAPTEEAADPISPTTYMLNVFPAEVPDLTEPTA